MKRRAGQQTKYIGKLCNTDRMMITKIMSIVLSPTQNISLKGSWSHIWKRSFRVLTDRSLAYFIFPLIRQSPRTKYQFCKSRVHSGEGTHHLGLTQQCRTLGHATLAYSISPPSFPLTPQSWSG